MHYKDEAPDSDVIGPIGMQRLCDDLHVDPSDVVMLVLAWKLQVHAHEVAIVEFDLFPQASVSCEFSRKEWIDGMTKMWFVYLFCLAVTIGLRQR